MAINDANRTVACTIRYHAEFWRCRKWKSPAWSPGIGRFGCGDTLKSGHGTTWRPGFSRCELRCTRRAKKVQLLHLGHWFWCLNHLL